MIEKNPLEIFQKAKLNPALAFETYLTVHDRTTGTYIPFIPTENQKELLSNVERYRFNVAKKTRQTGSTSFLAAYAAVKLMMPIDPSKPEHIFYSTTRGDIASDFIRLVEEFVLQLPTFEFGFLEEGTSVFKTLPSKRELKLKNGATIKVNGGGFKNIETALCGYSVTHAMIDEAAYIDGGRDAYNMLMPVISSNANSKITLVSTPNGKGGFFKDIYEQAVDGVNSYQPTTMTWFKDERFNKGLVWKKNGETSIEDEYTSESMSKKLDFGWKPSSLWYEQMCDGFNQDINMIRQELDGEFVGPDF